MLNSNGPRTVPWGPPSVAHEERRRLVVDHYPLLPIVKKISEPAKICAANATGLQSQEQVLMQNIVECLWQVNEDSGCVLFLVTSLAPVIAIESCQEEIWARVQSSESKLKLTEQLSVWQKRRTSSNTIFSRTLETRGVKENFWCRYVLLSRYKNRYNVPNFKIGRDLTWSHQFRETHWRELQVAKLFCLQPPLAPFNKFRHVQLPSFRSFS